MEQALNDDLLVGIKAIANHLGRPEREIYYLAEKKMLPLFRWGEKKWAGKKSTLARHFEKLEAGEEMQKAASA